MIAMENATTRGRSADVGSEYLTCRIGEVAYAIDILKVQEIRRYEAPTPLSATDAPSHTLGVVNLRGAITPITDLRLLLGTGRAAYDDATVTIIVEVDGAPRGLVVDSVSAVAELPRIDPLPKMAAGGVVRCARGAALVDDQMIVVLDSDALFAMADEEAIA